MIPPDCAPLHPVEALYADHHGWLRGWLRKKLGNVFDAADLAHDTYVKLLSAGNTSSPEDPRRHLALIANGLVVDLYRRRRIEAAYLETISHLPEARAPSPETQALVLEALVEIDAILDTLPAKVRQALLLHKLEGLNYREIGERLQVSTSSVEKYVARALLACCVAIGDASA